MTLDLPGETIAEINLIGTGGGYGESIVAHLGHNNWIVIDSCLNKDSGVPLALEYLEKIKVPGDHVKLILCTHWHDDHLRGMSELITAFPSAEVCLAWPSKIQSFFTLADLDYKPKKQHGKDKSITTAEYSKILKILDTRKAGHLVAKVDTTLLKERSGDVEMEVVALSPSDETTVGYVVKISELEERLRKEKASRLPIDEPNDLSVVAWLKLGPHHRALLGADLEGTGAGGAWSDILTKSKTIRSEPRSGLFKIPHHGSVNAYEPEVWKHLIKEQAIAKLTPWNLGKKLPRPEMIKKYKTHTDKLYITCRLKEVLTKDEKKLRAALKINSVGFRPVHYEYGHIRSRIDISDPDAAWEVQYEGSACPCK